METLFLEKTDKFGMPWCLKNSSGHHIHGGKTPEMLRQWARRHGYSINRVDKNAKILEILSKYPGGQTPTQIGLEMGRSYEAASANIAYNLQQLVNKGLVERISQYPRTVLYRRIINT